MLFRVVWDEKTDRMFCLPDILARAGMLSGEGVSQRFLWVLSSAVPYVFLEEMDSGSRDVAQRAGHREKEGYQSRIGHWEGLLGPTLARVSSPQEGVACLKRAAGELGMSLFEVDFVRSGEYGSGEYECTPKPALYENLAQCLCGRQIADDEVLRLAREHACTESEIWGFLQREVTEGRGIWMAAVGRKRWGWGMECRRCGCRSVEEWPGYYGRGFSCGECMSLGGMSSLNVLWRCREPESSQGNERSHFSHISTVLNMPFALSEAQQRASRELERSPSSKVLVWAACGAGKTEVCFARIAQVLQEGKRVLFAAPRRDVIHDIAPRLGAAFPHVTRSMLSGASPERFAGGQLVAATTHQVLRFYQAFDLIVLDELDAFPFTEGELLRRAVDQALRPGGHMICLTATPDAHILWAVRTRRWGLVQLAARFHRRPLPVPVWKKCRLSSEGGSEGLGGETRGGAKEEAGMREVLREVLERLSAKGITLFFVPRVADVSLWRERLCSLLPHKCVCGSWGNDPKRVSKIQALRAGEYDIFVTTTILERGITLDRAQVVVYRADHPLFDERTLVQMAGRAGRKRENPNGEVVFLAGHCSRAMRKAERWILKQNALARRQGLIDY